MNKHHTYITPAEAARLHEQAGYGSVGKFTVIQWIKQFRLGLKIGGRWKMDKAKFEKFLKEGTYREEA